MADEKQIRKTVKKLKDQRDEAVKEATEAAAAATAAADSEIASLNGALYDRDHRIANLETQVKDLSQLKTDNAKALALSLEVSEQQLNLISAHEKRIGELVAFTEDGDVKRYQKRIREKSEEIDRLKTQLKQTEEECRALALISQRLQAEVIRLSKDKTKVSTTPPPTSSEARALP